MRDWPQSVPIWAIDRVANPRVAGQSSHDRSARIRSARTHSTKIELTESRHPVSSVRRRRLVATSLSAVAMLTLGACGFDAQTNQQYQPAVGANYRSPAIDVLNTLLVSNANKSATLSASVINNTGAQQALSSVTVTTLDGTKTLPVRSAKILLPLPQDAAAVLGQASDAGGFVVTNGAEAGYYVKVTLNFTDSAPVTIDAPVVARTADYNFVTSS